MFQFLCVVTFYFYHILYLRTTVLVSLCCYQSKWDEIQIKGDDVLVSLCCYNCYKFSLDEYEKFQFLCVVTAIYRTIIHPKSAFQFLCVVTVFFMKTLLSKAMFQFLCVVTCLICAREPWENVLVSLCCYRFYISIFAVVL